jgi:hypothetical protein
VSGALEYKPDWEETKQRFRAWWNREDFGRCGIAVRAPRAGIPDVEAPPLPRRLEDRWLDLEYICSANEHRMSRAFYGGEALPVWNAGYPGWDTIQSFLGSPIVLKEDTGWNLPTFGDGKLADHDYRTLAIAPDNRWWLFADRVHRLAVEESKGKSLPGIQGIGGTGDTLAALRGTQALLYDVMDCPEYVHEFDAHLIRLWAEVYEKFHQITREGAEGSTTWTHLWSPGRYYLPHNDFSNMISPGVFRDLFLPTIRWQTEYLDHSLYHLDGELSYRHLDALLELPKLGGIQVLTSVGHSPLEHLDVLTKVQRAGKNVFIILKHDEVEYALAHLSSRGLFIDTECTTQEEAERLLANAERWSKVRDR